MTVYHDPYARQWARHYAEKRRQGRVNAAKAADPEMQAKVKAILDDLSASVKCVTVDGRRL